MSECQHPEWYVSGDRAWCARCGTPVALQDQGEASSLGEVIPVLERISDELPEGASLQDAIDHLRASKG